MSWTERSHLRRIAMVVIAALAVALASGALVVAKSDSAVNVRYARAALPAGRLSIPDGATSLTWQSDVFDPGFAFTELVASWNADAPAGTIVEVDMQATPDNARWTKWYVMGRWAYDDTTFLRTSVPAQGDRDGYVAIDTFVAGKIPMVAYRLQVVLTGTSGTSPTVRSLGAMASNVPAKFAVPSTRTFTGAATLPWDVPAYSQEIHAGDYPQFDGGGEAWCSPTSTSMVVAYWGRGPSAADLSYIPAGHTDPQVDYAARYTYDYNYHGTGNWPFNTAYAARYGLDAFVTRLRSLNEAELFIRAGIPLVASIGVDSNKLDGFMFKSSNGHLLVIVGITAEGNVVVNDPAAPSDLAVPRVYDRAQFEDAWLNHSGGIVYVIHDPSVPLPPPPTQANW